MFVILTGVVDLVTEASQGEKIVTCIEPGQFLGEQAIVRNEPFIRIFGARARSLVRVLELDKAAIDALAVQSPPLLIDILKGVFQIASDRLNRANQIITILRSNNKEEKLLSLLLYFSKTLGKNSPQGVELVLENSTINYYVEIGDREIHELLVKWEDALLISRGSNGLITIFDESALSANVRDPISITVI